MDNGEGTQSIVLRIPAPLSRQVRGFISESASGYASIDEFAEVALANQLSLERSGTGSSTSSESTIPTNRNEDHSARELLKSLQDIGSLPDIQESLSEPNYSQEALFVLTNRLSPIKVAARALANLAVQDGWPDVREFQASAARAAREVGTKLRDEDRKARRLGPDRRWVGYPVGDNIAAAYERFADSFTIQPGEKFGRGAMATLGLATVVDGTVRLTTSGWKLAREPSPVLDETMHDFTLSPIECDILVQQIKQSHNEFESIREFISCVKRALGSQPRVDELISSRNANWSQAYTVAHRAAMLGRLIDLQMVALAGRGDAAVITLLPSSEVFFR